MGRESIVSSAFVLGSTLIGSSQFLSRACRWTCSRGRLWGVLPKRGRSIVSSHAVIAVASGASEVSDTSGNGASDLPLECGDEDDGNNLGRLSIPDGAKLMDASAPGDAESPLERMLQRLKFNYENVDVCDGKGGYVAPKCTSSTATGNKICIRYRCIHGHVIRCFANTMATQYCPSCNASHALRASKRKLSLFELRQTARENGGTLISTEYVNARTPVTWKCRQGHVWKASACNIRNGRTWCPECARQRRKLGLTDMHELAAKFGGECLSEQYISQYVKLEWRCGRGHTFWLAPNNIARSPGGKRKPTWCKICRRLDGDVVRPRQSKRTQSTLGHRSRKNTAPSKHSKKL